MNNEFYDNISEIPSHLKQPTEQNGKRRSCKIDILYGLVHPLLHEHWLTCGYKLLLSLKLTAKVPENRPGPPKEDVSKHIPPP